ncbi:hypothetical protein [Streptomyces sp. H27-D2]|uniref:hypothetical protein n=1 Tax=Streptomyces sp. H27-D2 TaxID=3046304 RepID=UPI002DBF7A55|nr:hypothetical protein [Streptomyces sp. H27-D2]MEC4020220.1 hypothetical protein [Streptomyces sp. H27-D2]
MADDDDHEGKTFKITDEVLKDYANAKLPRFQEGLRGNLEYAQLGSGEQLAPGKPDLYLPAKNLQTLFGTFSTDLHARFESAVALMSKFSQDLLDVDLLLDEAEKDADSIAVPTLSEDLKNILTAKAP